MAACFTLQPVSGASAPYALQPVTPGEPCGEALVLMTGSEYFNLTASPFAMSAEDGAVVSVFIVVVWCAAYAWKAARKSLDVADE